MKPFFSIIIPTLNEEKYLPQLLSDLCNQTYQDFEVIIVDGQSKDKTVTKATIYQKKLDLKIITSQIQNVCYQRNLGSSTAKSDYLIFMDADNRLPNYFLQGIKYRLDSSPFDLFTTWILPDGKDMGSLAISNIINLWLDVQQNTNEPWLIEAMLVIKKRIFQSLKGFDVNIHINEGYDLVSRAIRKKYLYKVYKDPAYTFSLRRLKKVGAFKTISSVAQLEIARITKQKLTKGQIRKLYPMEGGGFFDHQNKVVLTKLKSRLIKTIQSILSA